MTRKRPATRPPPLRATLRHVLALSLATPAALGTTATACRQTSEPRPSGSVDAGAEASTDASCVYDPSYDDKGACAPVRVEAGLFGEDGSCASFVYLPCGLPPCLPISSCHPDIDLCVSVCPEEFFTTCQLPAPTCGEDGAVAPDAAVYLDCSTCLGNIGRRPAGFVTRTEGRGATPVGRYFSLAAHLERASVDAFLQLRERLASFGAPIGLRRRALRAVGDERRHARTTARLARRHQGEVHAVAPCKDAPLTFEAFVLENAVEGCVRETFGALLAMHQRDRASDAGVRKAMYRIAADETRHAELAWAIHRWALPRLSGAARRRVRAAQRCALADLRAGAGAWPSEVVVVAGMPDATVEAKLVEHFGREVLGASTRRVIRGNVASFPHARRFQAPHS